MKVIIMSGIPGSGKSAYVKERYSNASIISADQYFMVGNKYRFDQTKIGEAHKTCLRRFVYLVDYNGWGMYDFSHRTVIVDNTNTTATEIAPYYELAAAYGHDIEIITVLCDPKIAAARNTHGVPTDEVERMWKRLSNRVLPEHWTKPTFIGEDFK